MSDTLQLNYSHRCQQCGAPEKVVSKWVFVATGKRGDRAGKRELRVERGFVCGYGKVHRSQFSTLHTTTVPVFPSNVNVTDLNCHEVGHMTTRGVSNPQHQRHPYRGPGSYTTMNFLGRSNMDGNTWLPNSSNMAVRPTNSNESLASQIPLAYHLPRGEVHFSPVSSHFPSPTTQFSAPSYQQTPHIPYNPSPLNPDQSSGNEKQGHQTYVMHGHHQPGLQMYQQDPQAFHHSGRGNGYQQNEQHVQQGPGVMSSLGYSGYAQQPSTHVNLHPTQQHAGQDGFMNSQQPFQGQPFGTGYRQGASQYSHSQQTQQTAYRPQGQGMHYPLMSNEGPRDGGYQHSVGHGYADPAQNHPRPSGSRSISNQTYASDFEDPPYKSSGFVPSSAVHSQPYGSQGIPIQHSAQFQPRISQTFALQEKADNQPWGRQYEHHGNQESDSERTNVGILPANPVHARSSQISPRTAPATDPLPASKSGLGSLTGSPVKFTGTETPSRGSASQVTRTATPPTVVQFTRSLTSSVRSREGQSVTALRIDPVRGPPPAFWPGTDRPVAPSSAPAPPGSMYQISNKNFIAGEAGQDPFTTSGYVISPPTMGRSVSQGTVNPFGPVQATAGLIAPIALPQQHRPGPSQHLATIAPNGNLPTIEVALDAGNLPFIEPARLAHPVTYGVVKITNIPYNVTRAEIVAFLGRNARIVNEAEEPIHIIMERVTSKTMEAYIEFSSMQEAVTAVNRYEVNRNGGRSGRLGERHVDLEVSGQEKLMAELFPKARNVRWIGSRPQISPTDPNDPYNSGFKGFVTNEEMVMLVKHVEAPQRSPFSKDCPQRPYECLISTLVKYPWYMVDNITLEARDLMYNSSRDLVQILVNRLNDEGNEEPSIHINDRLLRRVRTAVCRCPGFTEQQKDDIAFLCGLDGKTAGLTPFADDWVAFKTIGPKPGIQPDVIYYYVALLREATTSSSVVSLGERAARETHHASGKPKFFGNVVVQYPENVKMMSLAQIAMLEWNVIEMLLRQRLQV